jgi:Rrf2 family protein
MLKVSTRVRYGTRALVQIAGARPGRAVPVQAIARAQRVSGKYLEQIVSSLKAAGLVRSARGTRGGYLLARPAKAVRLAEVVRALDGPPVVVECVDVPEMCGLHATCPMRDVWARVREAIDKVLDGTTLEDLVEASQAKGGGSPLSYVI